MHTKKHAESDVYFAFNEHVAVNRFLLILDVSPSPRTKECDELPRPGSWDLGPPRVVGILAQSLPLSGSDHEPTSDSQQRAPGGMPEPGSEAHYRMVPSARSPGQENIYEMC